MDDIIQDQYNKLANKHKILQKYNALHITEINNLQKKVKFLESLINNNIDIQSENQILQNIYNIIKIYKQELTYI